MNTHNIWFCGEIRNMPVKKKQEGHDGLVLHTWISALTVADLEMIKGNILTGIHGDYILTSKTM